MMAIDTEDMELKSARDARVMKATIDVPLRELARRVRTAEGFLSDVLHERPATRRMLQRISFALSEAEAERQAAAPKVAPEPRIRRL